MHLLHCIKRQRTLVCFGLLHLLLGLSACGSATGNTDAGLRAYRDPTTGELRAATAAERTALPPIGTARMAADTRPERIELPEGGTGLRYHGRSGICARVADNGKLEQHDCPAAAP